MGGKSIPRWSIPRVIINIFAKINPKIKYKLDKLFGDECYSSEKIEVLGFKAKKHWKIWVKHLFDSFFFCRLTLQVSMLYEEWLIRAIPEFKLQCDIEDILFVKYKDF